MIPLLLVAGDSWAQGGGTPPQAPGVVCGQQTAALIGRVYYLANPISEQTNPQDLVDFIQANGHLLARGSSFAICSDLAGRRLVTRGILTYSPQDADRAYESSLGMGATMDQANQVRTSINQGSVDAVAIGQELVWLAAVIPEAAAGNWGPYNSTGPMARQQTRVVWPLYEAMVGTDPSMQAMLDQIMLQFQPWIEYQAASLVLLLGN
jgi:hypothetical protein